MISQFIRVKTFMTFKQQISLEVYVLSEVYILIKTIATRAFTFFSGEKVSSCLHAELFRFFFFFCSGASNLLFSGVIFLFLFAFSSLFWVRQTLFFLTTDDFSSSFAEKKRKINHSLFSLKWHRDLFVYHSKTGVINDFFIYRAMCHLC